MQQILADILHTIGQAMLTPCLIILALLMIAALWQIGDVLVEWFKVRRPHKLKVTELIKEIHSSAENGGAAAIRETVAESGLLNRQKNALYRVLDAPELYTHGATITAIAEKALASEEDYYNRQVQITDTIAKLGPSFGLLGTLIPLGPGITALGNGDTAALAASVGVAFDTTIAGLLAASAAVVISGRRKHWYGNYMTELETVMEAVLEEIQMLNTNKRRLTRRVHSFEKATPNPMENLANLVDVMLVFACALMIAIITYWNVDLTQSKISKEDLEPVDDMQEAIQNDIDSEVLQSKGRVYEDPETGELYIVTN